MKKIVLIEDEESLGKKTADFLNTTEEYRVVACATSGREGIDVVLHCRPDAVILDMVLPELDGFSVMDAIRRQDRTVKFLVTSAFGSESVIQNAIHHGAGYFLVKPVDFDVLLKRLNDLFVPAEVAPTATEAVEISFSSRKLDEKISNIFITVGIPPHIKGYGYLREGVKMAIRSPEVINNITKKLYPMIGEKYDTSASKVERAIRHAIEVAWNRGRIETINSLFGVRAYVGNEKPTNGEFIALVADKMLLEGLN